MTLQTVRSLFSSLFAAAWLASAATLHARDLPGVVLSGNLAAGGEREVTVAEIEGLGLSEELAVFEPYEKKSFRFRGVWLDRFVQAYGKADTRQLECVAIDEYTITFTRAEWERERILLVTRTNGEPMDFDTKGPVRIVYPDYDPHDLGELEQIHKWIWMITDITFLK